ncbi:MAG: hypothetical protein HYX94_12075 [Chloroflexi bacterium]|nr:hypothetical protein [Chloroflexota bacterium]
MVNGRLKQVRAVITVTIAVVALLALGGCRSDSAAVASQKADALSVSKVVQKAQVGEMELTVTWQNPSRSPTLPLQFKVQMDIHAGSLDEYDLASVSSLANDRGQQVNASRWEAPGGGHHGAGALFFPPADAAGKPLIDGDTKYVEWTISGLGGAAEKKTVRWEITQ